VAATLGHNNENSYVPQLNLVLLLALGKKHPSFFRTVPGSIGDISTVSATLEEAGIKKGDTDRGQGVLLEAQRQLPREEEAAVHTAAEEGQQPH